MTTRDPMTPPLFDCAAVDARLADYLDDEPPGGLAPGERAAVDQHVAACARCRALVRDLGALADHAAALPALAPPRDLWPDIAARLTPRAPAAHAPAADAPARVIPIEVHRLRYAPPAVAPRGGAVAGRGAPVAWGRRQLAAAAVALVAVSAGSTYLLTRAAGDATRPAGAAPALAAADPARPGAAPGTRAGPAAPVASASEQTVASAAVGGATPTPDAEASNDGSAGTGAPAGAPRGDARGARRPRAAEPSGGARLVAGPAESDAAVLAAAAYDQEIAALRAAVRERRGDLDSATVAVLVRNLGIIDAAIAQSRAALARDPHSPLLGDQLTRALGQKVELLRTVALLPRT